MFGWLVVLIVAILQHIFHDERDVFDELCVRLIHDHLTVVIEELFHNSFNLVKEDRIESWSHFVTDEFFNVLLNLRAELFIGAQKQSQEVANEGSDWTVLIVVLKLAQVACNQLKKEMFLSNKKFGRF